MGLKFYRLLRTNEVEFFQVIQKETSDIYGYILIVDSRRKEKLCDNPVLIGMEDENEYEVPQTLFRSLHSLKKDIFKTLQLIPFLL